MRRLCAVLAIAVAGGGLAMSMGVEARPADQQESAELSLESGQSTTSTSDAIASNTAVRQAWTQGGCTFTASPLLGKLKLLNLWTITVKNYAGTQTLLKLSEIKLLSGNKPAEAAKTITRAISLLQQQTTKPRAEVRLAFINGVLVRARSFDAS